MSGKPHFVAIIGQAVLLTAFVLFMTAWFAAPHVSPKGLQGLIGAAAAILVVAIPDGVGAWWIYRKLSASYTKREVWAVSITFAVTVPVAMAVGMLLGELTGGYADVIFNTQSRATAFAGALAGVVAVTAAGSLGFCALALLIARRAAG